MKIKQGFVSNSSSTSFCIIGTTRTFDIHRLAEAEGFLFPKMFHDTKTVQVRGCDHQEGTTQFCPECGLPMWYTDSIEPSYTSLDYGYREGKVITFYGDYDPYRAGVNAKELLAHFSLDKAKVHVQGIIKEKLDVDIAIENIDLYYGEAGDG